jgi:hypothetical protein
MANKETEPVVTTWIPEAHDHNTVTASPVIETPVVEETPIVEEEVTE